MEQETLKDLTVLIARASPWHLGHCEVLKRALETSKAVLVLVGSSGQARNTKNPFTFEERADMINRWVISGLFKEYNLQNSDQLCLRIRPIYDHPYNDQAWYRGIQEEVELAKTGYANVIGLNPKVYLTGADRDKSTWYLHSFGDLFIQDFVTEHKHGLELSATHVRDQLFGKGFIDEALLPPTTIAFLRSFIKTPEYADLVKEYRFIEDYKKAWSAAPYAPTFVTVDTCVIQSGHILVNVRDNFPGQGLWALPGGFLEQDEKLLDGAIRELKEETRIELSNAQLYGAVKSKEIFDNPGRSLRGRTITTCFLLRLDDKKPLPKVKPQKGEVRKCMWLPIHEALNNREKWFEDHYHLASWGINQL